MIDLFVSMDNRTESIIEYILETMPYKLNDIVSMDFEQVFRVFNRGQAKQERINLANQK